MSWKKNLTQSRLRPVSPFSYVGRGRKGAQVKPKKEIIHRSSQRPQRRGKNSVFVIFVAFCADLFFAVVGITRGLLIFRFNFAPFASSADVAKGGDGAKSALREIWNSLSVAIKVFSCGYEYAG
jgi:hypothetical protein